MKKLITISLHILFAQLIFSQEDTAKVLIDTLKTNEVDATFLLLKKADSISKIVLRKQLDELYLSYELNAHASDSDKLPLTYCELHQNIQDGFNDSGIEILSSDYRAAKNGNHIAIPTD